MGIVAGEAIETGAVDPGPRGLVSLFGVGAAEFEAKQDVAEHGFPGEKRVLLKHVGGFAVYAVERLAEDFDGA